MPIIPKDSENVTGSTVTKQDEPSTILPMEEKEKTFFNPQTGLVDKFKGTKEEYTKDQNVKTIKKYFEPAAKSITDFTQNPDVQDKAMQMMSYLDNTTYEDGQNAADAFVDYTRGREFNLTKSLYETAKTLKGRAKNDPEAQKFIENYSSLMNEFHSTNPNGKSKYENIGLNETLTLTGDVFKGILTDPANIPILFTGPGGIPPKIAMQQAASQTLRQGIKNMAAKGYNVSLGKVAPVYNAIPKIPLNTRSYKSSIGILGTEGAIYGGLDSHLYQKRYNEIGVEGYEEYDPRLTATGAVFGFTFGSVLGGGTTLVLNRLDKKATSEAAEQATRESEQFQRTILDEPDPDAEVPEIITLEKAAELNRKERERNPQLSNKTHVEEVADFERRAADEEALLPENFVNRVIDNDGIIITDKTVSQVIKEESKKVKPKIGGFQKYREEGGTILLGKSMRMFQKPSTYSKQTGEVSKFLEEAGVDQGGTAYRFLRLIRNDAFENWNDDIVKIATDYDYGQRQFSEQIADASGKYMARVEKLKFEIEDIARNENRYNRGTGLYLRKKDWALKEGTTLNDDLYMFLNQGRFKQGVPESIIRKAAEFRKVYDDVEREAIQSGFVFHKVPNFFPRYLKESKIKRSLGEERYAQQLVDDGYFDTIPDAKNAISSQLNKLHDDFEPSSGSIGQRTYKNLDTYKIKDLFEHDVYATTMAYVNSTSRKIVTKRTLGFGEVEQDNKWFIPMYGGNLVKTERQTALENIREHLTARGFAKEIVKDKSLSKYIQSNFLARQLSDDDSMLLSELVKTNARLRSNNSIINNSFKFNNLSVQERASLLNNTFQEEIDKIILNNFNSGTFTKQNQKVVGELSEVNVNYTKGRYSSDEKARMKVLVENITGQYGRSSKGLEQFTGNLLALQAANKLSLATLSSLPEMFIPLFKATPKLAIQAFTKTLYEEGVKSASNLVSGTKGLPTLTRAEMHQHNKMMSSGLNEAINARYGDGLSGISQKLTYRFYRTIFLDQYTKFVQIYSYNAGKLLIRENLSKLDKMGKEAYNTKNKKAMRLRSTINQLGVNVDEGIKWHQAGGKLDDAFYENLRQSADRFVNEVVMIPSRENAQKFIASSHWAARLAFQLYSYPISFSNTVLRNAIRDMRMTKGAAVPKHLAGGALMYFATGFTQRLKGINEVDDEPIDQLINTLTTMGVAGPFDLAHNFTEAISYGSNTPRSLLKLMGPTLGGMLADSLQGDTPFSSAIFKNTMPYRNLMRRISPEKIHELDEFLKDIERRAQGKGTYTRGKARREADKRFAQRKMRAQQRPAKQKIKEAREKLATGGKLSVDYPVPFVKDNPTERKIDNTNQSFAIVSRLFEEEDRVPLSLGGKLANKLIKTNLFKKKAGWKWTEVPEGFDPNPDGQFPIVSVETGGKHLYSLQADFPEGVLLERYAKQKSEPRLRPTTKGVVRTGNKVGEIKTSSGKLHPVYDNIVAVDEKTKAVKGLKDMPTNVMPAPQRFFDLEDKGYKPFLSNFDYIKGGRYVELNKEGNKDVTSATPKQARISISPEGKASFTISKEFHDSIFPQQTIRQFHGTKKELPEVLEDFDMGYQGSESNIYGAGFYTTSASGIAKGYAKKTDLGTGVTDKGFVYEITEKKGNKLYNLDTKVPEQIKKDILEPEYDFSSDLEGELAGFLEENSNASFLELYDEARDISSGYKIPTYEVQELFNGWAMYLIEQGYNGLRHKGGVLSGGKEHDVKIYWNPSKSLNVKPLK